MAQRIFDESDEEVVGGSDDEEGEEIILHSDHNSESEQEADNDSHDFETVSVVTNEPIMKGRDKETVWRKHPTVKKFLKTHKKNLVKIFPKATVDKELVTDEMNSFLLFFTTEMIEDITRFTNLYIVSIQDSFQRERDAKQTTKDEM